MAFIADLVEHVIQTVDRIDNLTHIGFLNGEQFVVPQFMALLSAVVAIAVAVDAIDIVSGVEGMTIPWIVGAESSFFWLATLQPLKSTTAT